MEWFTPSEASGEEQFHHRVTETRGRKNRPRNGELMPRVVELHLGGTSIRQYYKDCRGSFDCGNRIAGREAPQRCVIRITVTVSASLIKSF